MPRVTDAYLAERRAHVLEAARTCFLREGFHATSMQDVFAEAGLSAGAVYRYFASKDEMILAICEENLREVTSLIEARVARHGESLGEVLAGVLEVIHEQHTERGIGALALQVWSEAARNPALRERFTARLAEIRAWLLDLARAQQRAGMLPPGVDATTLAAVFGLLVPGYMQQLALGGPQAVEGIGDALRALWPDQPAAS